MNTLRFGRDCMQLALILYMVLLEVKMDETIEQDPYLLWIPWLGIARQPLTS